MYIAKIFPRIKIQESKLKCSSFLINRQPNAIKTAKSNKVGISERSMRDNTHATN